MSAPTPAPARPRRRAGRIWGTVAAIIVAFAALLVVADVVVRDIAEDRFGEQIRANLPDGIDGEVDVKIGGFSVIAQYLAGTMDRIELSAPELDVNGTPVAVDVIGEGVPVDLASPVTAVAGTITVDEESLSRLVTVPGVNGAFTLGDGVVGYAGTIEVLGLSLDYSATARPTAAGETVLLLPEGVEITSGAGVVDVSVVVGRLLGDDPLAICVAQYLPEGVEVHDLAIAPGTATVELRAKGLMLDEASLARTGSCD
ncbi:LmeA family phospholipid-binding protein [Agromyces bauzanensis]